MGKISSFSCAIAADSGSPATTVWPGYFFSRRVPWQQRQAGVYDCRWGTDVVRVVVTGELSLEAHNAPLHLFSASADRLGFGRGAYRRRSERTSRLLGQLFERFRGEGLVMPYTIEDFERDYIKEHFPRLTLEERQQALQLLPPEERRELLQSLPPEERRDALQSLPPEQRLEFLRSLPPEERREYLQSLPPEELLGVLSPEQIRDYLDHLPAGQKAQPRRPRRKK